MAKVKGKAGRKSMLTKETEWRICDIIRKGHTQAAAARAANIHPTTLTRWLTEGRRHRRGKYRRLLQAVEKARSQLCEDLDAVEHEIAMDRSLPAAVRLRAVQQIRTRVFAHAAPMATIDVYHHAVLEHAPSTREAEQPPRSIVTDSELNGAPTEVLADMLESLRQARARLPDNSRMQDDDEDGDVIDASEVA